MRTGKPARKLSSDAQVFDLSLLNPTSLKSEGAFEGAIRTFESHLLFLDDGNRATLLDGLLDWANKFEFVMAVINDDTALALTSWILETFPSSVGLFLSSPQSYLLVRLSGYFGGLSDAPSTKDTQVAVQAAQTCLRLLHEMLSTDDSTLLTLDSASKRKKRKDSKNAHLRTNAKAFGDIGLHVPSTTSQAMSLQSDLLHDQRRILQEFFSILRDPQHRETFKGAYLLAEPTRIGDNYKISFASRPLQKDEASGIKRSGGNKHSEPVEGFGTWRIWVSNRADGQLRIMHKKDFRLFGLTMELLKDLSLGRFSNRNRIQATYASIPIPIYKANISHNMILLYHVHCIPNCECGITHQVLRILAIETLSKLNVAFWDSAAKVLSRYGVEYQRRCTAQLTRPYSGGTIFTPAPFPALSDVRVKEEAEEFLPSLHDTDISAELHHLLAPDNFHELSRTTLDNIMTDRKASSYLNTLSQQAIPKQASSLYVIDRSSNGEKTTMLFKKHLSNGPSGTKGTVLEEVGEISALLGQERQRPPQDDAEKSGDEDLLAITPPIQLDSLAIQSLPGQLPSDNLDCTESQSVVVGDREEGHSDIEEVNLRSFGEFVVTQTVPTEISFTVHHDAAARIIQRAARHHFRRRHELSNGGLAARRMEAFQQYFQASKYMVWLSRRQRVLFLGALPHLLFCIQEIRTYAHKQKAKAKKRIVGEDPTKNASTLSLNEATKLLKAADKLHKELKPDSDVHWKKDWERLKKAIQQVADVMNTHPPAFLNTLRDDFELGYGAMIEGLDLLISGDSEAGDPETTDANEFSLPDMNEDESQLEFGLQGV